MARDGYRTGMGIHRVYSLALIAILSLQCVLAPMHVIGDEATCLHEKMVRDSELPVVWARCGAARTNYLAHYASDVQSEDSTVDKHDQHQHDDHRHFASDHEVVNGRNILAKDVLTASTEFSNFSTPLQLSMSPSAADDHAPIEPFSTTPPGRGPPSVQEFTSIA